MPTWIAIPDRIIEHIRIPIEALWPPRLRDERIRAEEPPQAGSIEPRAVIIHPQRDLLPLAGEAAVGGEGAGREVGPRFTVGEVAPLAEQGPGHGSGQGGAAQGVRVEVGEGDARLHGDPRPAEVVKVPLHYSRRRLGYKSRCEGAAAMELLAAGGTPLREPPTNTDSSRWPVKQPMNLRHYQ